MSTPHRDEWSGRRLDDADFSYARLHSPNFEGAKITDGWLANADISAFIGGPRINGVTIAPLVTAELDRMFPERILLRAGDPNGLAEAWTRIERVWADTVSRARALPAALLSVHLVATGANRCDVPMVLPSARRGSAHSNPLSTECVRSPGIASSLRASDQIILLR